MDTINCNGAILNGMISEFTTTRTVDGGSGTEGTYRIAIREVGTSTPDQITIRVQVDWQRFRGEDTGFDADRAVVVEQTFFRFEYELQPN
jgi:hypothetical protein